jgi:hypothetical protein
MEATMNASCRASPFGRITRFSAVFTLSVLAAGCSPYSTIAKIGMKVVGETVSDADVSQKSQELLGQPVVRADTALGQRIRTLEELRTRRQMIMYPVKDDLLNMFRWAVETENGRIVALAKLQNDPDGGKDIAEKLVLKEIVGGKTPEQIQTHDWFKNLVLVLRDGSSGNLVRVYDTSLIPSFMGAKYCVLEFDGSDRCQSVRIVGVPASTPGSAVGN